MLRQKVWVDKSVQGVLVGRVLLYWCCAALYLVIGSACFQYNQNPEWTLSQHVQVLFGQTWPWMPTAILVLPLTIYDVIRLSNLFAGPVYRLRKHFVKMRQDIACAPLTFRTDDYWHDLAAPINDMQAEILRLRAGVIELQHAAAQTTALIADFKARSHESANTEATDDEAAALHSAAAQESLASETHGPSSGESTREAPISSIEPEVAIAPQISTRSSAMQTPASAPVN